MYFSRVILGCILCLICLTGEIQSRSSVKGQCASTFARILMEAKLGKLRADGILDMTLNLEYLNKEGKMQKTAIKVQEYCKKPKILCKGETGVLNDKTVFGPILYCSWRWNEKKPIDNYVIVRLGEKNGVTSLLDVAGLVSKDNEQIFPGASDKGLMDFNITQNLTREKAALRNKRDKAVPETTTEDHTTDSTEFDSPDTTEFDDENATEAGTFSTSGTEDDFDEHIAVTKAHVLEKNLEIFERSKSPCLRPAFFLWITSLCIAFCATKSA